MGNGPGQLSSYSQRLQTSFMKRRSYHRAIETDSIGASLKEPPATGGTPTSPVLSPFYAPPGHGRAPRASYDMDGNY